MNSGFKRVLIMKKTVSKNSLNCYFKLEKNLQMKENCFAQANIYANKTALKLATFNKTPK